MTNKIPDILKTAWQNILFLLFLAYLSSSYFLDNGKRRTVFFVLFLSSIPSLLPSLPHLLSKIRFPFPAFFLFSFYFTISASWGNGEWFNIIRDSLAIFSLALIIELNIYKLSHDFVAVFWTVVGGSVALICALLIYSSPEITQCAHKAMQCYPGMMDCVEKCRFSFQSFVPWSTPNPIDSANFLGLSIIAAWCIFPNKGRLCQLLLLFIMTICFAVMLETYTRGAIISLFCVITLDVLFFKRHKMNILLFVFLFSCAVVLHWDNLKLWVSRDVYRLEMWVLFFEKFRNWLFGSGFGTKANIVLREGIFIGRLHNSFLEILRQGGLLGSGLFMFMIFRMPLKYFFSVEHRFFFLWFLYGVSYLFSNGQILITHPGCMEMFFFWTPLFFLLSATKMKDTNPWKIKTYELDCYRLDLLKQQYGTLGGIIRFVRDIGRDTLYGLCAHFRLIQKISVDPCDFLLLQSAPKVVALNRKRGLKAALREHGHRLTEIALPEARDILRHRQLQRPPQALPLRYFLFAAHAEWLAERYRPRILLNDRNGSLYSPFLRLSLQRRGGLLVQLAHAATLEDSLKLSMNDYDYYFLFGQSSLDALRQRPLLFGDSRAILAGSHMVDDAYDLPPAEAQRDVVLILGVGPDKEKETGYQRSYQLLRDWLAAHPERRALIKAHPRSVVPFWTDAAKTLENLLVLPRETTLAQALEQSGIVINIMSNAVIEATLAQRPVLVVNLSGEADIFQQSRFLGAEIHDLDTLEREFLRIQQDYAESLSRSRAFASFHLESGARGLQRNVELLECLLRKEEIPFQPLSGNVEFRT
ncbi:MAG: O-antigen ligase family protein [Candidatus Accumulibacter sp.]|jgi:hypothetical protein|nr:O-antigen ligase family protein [Accumulibacter sp.]